MHVSFLLFPKRDNCADLRYHYSLRPFDIIWMCLVTKMLPSQTFQFVNALNECVITLPDECGHSLLYTNHSSPNKMMKYIYGGPQLIFHD